MQISIINHFVYSFVEVEPGLSILIMTIFVCKLNSNIFDVFHELESFSIFQLFKNINFIGKKDVNKPPEFNIIHCLHP